MKQQSSLTVLESSPSKSAIYKAKTGVGLRHLHYQQALNQKPDFIDFVEIHAENFFADGGIRLTLLDDIQEKYELSVHGTSLGLGSLVALPEDILTAFANLVERTQPILISEHLCFNRAIVNGQLKHSGDLLPIAYSQASLNNISAQIQRLQERIKRPILIENLSSYIRPSEMDESALDQMTEVEFIISLCKSAGCGLLLDLNNLLVNAHNQNIEDPVKSILEELEGLPTELVGEIHLAGYSKRKVHGFYVDDHGTSVSDDCWHLFSALKPRFMSAPVLIEWDTQLPEWSVLTEQARKAHLIANRIAK